MLCSGCSMGVRWPSCRIRAGLEIYVQYWRDSFLFPSLVPLVPVRLMLFVKIWADKVKRLVHCLSDISVKAKFYIDRQMWGKAPIFDISVNAFTSTSFQCADRLHTNSFTRRNWSEMLLPAHAHDGKVDGCCRFCGRRKAQRIRTITSCDLNGSNWKSFENSGTLFEIYYYGVDRLWAFQIVVL